jgi:hypothetical protein
LLLQVVEEVLATVALMVVELVQEDTDILQVKLF